MMEQETRYRQLTQEQLDNFTLDMNAAYARLKGMEEAIDSKTQQASRFYAYIFLFYVMK
jgi:MoxR-like ATPase